VEVEFSYKAIIETSTKSKIQNVDQVISVGVNSAESQENITIQMIEHQKI